MGVFFTAFMLGFFHGALMWVREKAQEAYYQPGF